MSPNKTQPESTFLSWWRHSFLGTEGYCNSTQVTRIWGTRMGSNLQLVLIAVGLPRTSDWLRAGLVGEFLASWQVTPYQHYACFSSPVDLYCNRVLVVVRDKRMSATTIGEAPIGSTPAPKTCSTTTYSDMVGVTSSFRWRRYSDTQEFVSGHYSGVLK